MAVNKITGQLANFIKRFKKRKKEEVDMPHCKKCGLTRPINEDGLCPVCVIMGRIETPPRYDGKTLGEGGVEWEDHPHGACAPTLVLADPRR